MNQIRVNRERECLGLARENLPTWEKAGNQAAPKGLMGLVSVPDLDQSRAVRDL